MNHDIQVDVRTIKDIGDGSITMQTSVDYLQCRKGDTVLFQGGDQKLGATIIKAEPMPVRECVGAEWLDGMSITFEV